MKKFLLVAFLGCCGSLISTFSQTGSWQFLNYTTNEGLPNNNVTSIQQDSLGYIWIGTENGLSWFNGLEFHNYHHKIADSTSIPGNNIIKIFIDSRKRIFVATSSGLSVYNPKLDHFIPVLGLRRQAVRDLVEDKYGNIWVATEGNGLYKISPALNVLAHFEKMGSLPEPVGKYIWKLYADDDDLWIGTLEGKLIKYSQQSNTFDVIEEYSNVNEYISYIGKDKKGNLIVFSRQAWLVRLEALPSGKYRIHRFPKVEGVNFNYGLIDCPNGNLWLSHSDGILVFDPAKGTFKDLKEDPDYAGLVLNPGAPVLFIDKNRHIWQARQNMGLSMIGNAYKPFFHNRDEVFASSYVNFISRISDQTILAATNIGGIMCKREKEDVFQVASDFDVFEQDKINTNTIYKILETARNEFLIATYHGLIYFNRNTGHKEYYYLNDKRINTLSSNHVYDMLMMDSSTVWLATNGGGINILNLPSRRFSYIKKENAPNGLVDDYCIALLKNRSGKVFIGTYNGLSVFNPQDKSFTSYLPEPNNSSSLSHNWIYCIYEDSRNNIWVGTYNGLNLFDEQKGSFRVFDKSTGLPDNVIFGIIEDDMHQLWVSTGKGIVRINPENYVCQAFGKEDGLKVVQFGRQSVYKERSGNILFGGEGGIVFFDPSEIKMNPYPPPVYITALKIFNKKIDAQSHPEILPEEITYLDKIEIPFSLNVLTFEFIGLNYINPARNTYAYQLTGFDKDWQYIEGKREVTYTNLDPGDYIFKVKAANNDGIWNETGTRIKVTILPPWWNTLIFRIGAALFVIVGAFGFYAYKVKSLHKHRERLERQVRERTYEIAEKNAALIQQTQSLNAINLLLEERQRHIENQAKELQVNSDNLRQVNELLVEKQKVELKQALDLKKTNDELRLLNATKDKFFSIIAHDLKNPFNSLLGFSEMLSRDFNNLTVDKQKQIADVMHDSSVRIYSLLENLLQWAGAQIGNITYKPEVFQLKEIIETNYGLVKEMLKEKETCFVSTLPEDSGVFADRNMVNTIIRNLLGNALKFTDKGSVSVVIKTQNKYQEISVIDSGVGIPEDKLKRLFDIGQSRSTWGTRGEKGTGLGLLICKEFIERNGGKLTINSKQGAGTTFTFTLPRSNE